MFQEEKENQLPDKLRQENTVGVYQEVFGESMSQHPELSEE